PLIDGLPTRLPIQPARGEVLVVETPHRLHSAVAGGDAYLVPRPNGVCVGSTFEMAGFDPAPSERGRETLRGYAAALMPAIADAARTAPIWCGLRPMTPDKLPIIDVDPADDRIVYACGHGKNGLLLAGLTG